MSIKCVSLVNLIIKLLKNWLSYLKYKLYLQIENKPKTKLLMLFLSMFLKNYLKIYSSFHRGIEKLIQ
jgi:hypothetical protein